MNDVSTDRHSIAADYALQDCEHDWTTVVIGERPEWCRACGAMKVGQLINEPHLRKVGRVILRLDEDSKG